MSKYVKNQSSNDPWLIDESGQTWRLGKNATISVDNMTAILAGPGHDNNTIRLKGDVVATDAGGMGVYLQGEDATLRIGKTSHVEAYASIVSSSTNGSISNAGDIAGDAYGVLLDVPSELVNRGEISGRNAVAAASGSEIHNLKGGLIDGEDHGIYIVDDEPTLIENHGTIRADDTAVVISDGEASTGSTLINTGKIVGDVLFGAGSDWIDSRSGRIKGIVDGGNGDDTYIVGKHSGQLSEKLDNGWDEVRSGRNVTLEANFEGITLLGKKSVDATGNAASNEIFGNAGDNVIRGENGSDFLGGGKGDDQLFGGANGDDFVFFDGDAHDRVMDFDVTQDQILLLEFGFDTFDEIVPLMSQHGTDTWISLGDGDRLILENVEMGNLTEEMFRFDITVIAAV